MESTGVGQQDEEVGVHEVRDKRREIVVVSDFSALNFIHGDDIVFVDDGDDAQLEHGEEGIAGVEVTLAVGEVAARQ